MAQLEVFALVRIGSQSHRGKFYNGRFGEAKGPNLVPEEISGVFPPVES